MARTLKAACPQCGAKFARRKGETEEGRALRLKTHVGGKGCKAAQLAAELILRGFTRMTWNSSRPRKRKKKTPRGDNQFVDGYHELKAADLIERHQTHVRFEDNVLVHETWGPQWAVDFVGHLRARRPTPTFQKRANEVSALASDPEGPERAKAFLALRGEGRS